MKQTELLHFAHRPEANGPYTEFLPVCRADMEKRGWDEVDFVVVGGDAYVDHPSFGTAIISRVLEAEGYRVAVLAQPRYDSCEDFKPAAATSTAW
jgi:hypothetical protein